MDWFIGWKQLEQRNGIRGASQVAECTARYRSRQWAIGNGKGGTGKTTLAMHVVVGLLDAGQKVSTLDQDSDQRCLTRCLDHRRVSAGQGVVHLSMPRHELVTAAEGVRVDESEAANLVSLESAIASVASSCDYLAMDTPSQDTYLGRVTHLVADLILTPLQDSFMDLCSLAVIDPDKPELVLAGRYAASVRAARKVRQQFDPNFSDWVAIRRRARGSSLVERYLSETGRQIGFRHIEGLGERTIYRQLFPLGTHGI